MTDVPVHLKFISMFIVLSVLVMGVDGLIYDNYNSRPSMAIKHMEVKPVIYVSPAPPSLEDYLKKFMQPPSLPPEQTPEDFFINGQSFPNTELIDVSEGDIVQLQFINNGKTSRQIHIHGHEFVVTHRDGFLLPTPIKVDTLLINSGERHDVWFEANNPGVWAIHDHTDVDMMYDPTSILTFIRYDELMTDDLKLFLGRVKRYMENAEHMDEDHGSQTRSSPIGGGVDVEDADVGGGGEH